MSITLLIIIATAIVSFMAFNNSNLISKFIFQPAAMENSNEWYRFFTCGLIHADIPHLAFNMLSLYFFGDMVEDAFKQLINPAIGSLVYLLMYVFALAVSLFPTYTQNKNNHYYQSLGASGAVSAVVFAGLLFYPTSKIGFFIIPPIIPGFIFGPIYLGLTVYLAKQNSDNINHSAHFWGAAFGIVYTIIICNGLTDYRVISAFTEQVVNYFR